MRNLTLIILGIFISTVGIAQDKIPFTQEMRDKLEANDLNLRQVQFYISKEIKLNRKASSKDIKLDAGKINFESKGNSDLVIIPKETEGICEDFTATTLKVKFEEGVNRGIQFQRTRDNIYQIAAEDWSTGSGKVKYDTSYFYLDKEGSNAFLLVKKADIRKNTKEKKKAKGLIC
jgi:hypothetical protein